MGLSEHTIQSLQFTKQIVQGMYSYLNIEKPNTDGGHTAEQRAIAHRAHLDKYLSLTRLLTPGRDNFVIIRRSPHALTAVSAQYSYASDWYYGFIADDFNGMGVDKGFVKVDDHTRQYLLAYMGDLMSLKSFPEDSLGENYSQITIFALAPGRWVDLRVEMQKLHPPSLREFLRDTERFINILVGKEEGYHHAMLVRSKADIKELSGQLTGL